eukprot:2705405-Rhodomonas_salina.1
MSTQQDENMDQGRVLRCSGLSKLEQLLRAIQYLPPSISFPQSSAALPPPSLSPPPPPPPPPQCFLPR